MTLIAMTSLNGTKFYKFKNDEEAKEFIEKERMKQIARMFATAFYGESNDNHKIPPNC